MTTPASPETTWVVPLSRWLAIGVAVVSVILLILLLAGGAGANLPGWLPYLLIAVLAVAAVMGNPLWPWTFGRWIAAGVALVAIVLLVLALSGGAGAVGLLAVLVLIAALAVALVIG